MGFELASQSITLTDIDFFKLRKPSSCDRRSSGAVRTKQKGRAAGAAFYLASGGISRRKPKRNPLAGGAQIVGRRLARAAICHDLVADLLAFTQRSKSGALYGADVHEHVVATVIRLNKAEALGRVKPLHGSHAHGG